MNVERPPIVPDGVIRRIRRDINDDFRRHLLRLTDFQRRMRFSGGVSDAFIDTYSRGFPGTRSVLLGYFLEGQMRGAGEMYLLSDIASRRNCEIAVSVEEAHQGQGIGTALMQRLLGLASNRRIRTMHVFWLHGNTRMERLARRFDAAVDSDGCQVEAVVKVAPPSDLSLFEEALSDGARHSIPAPFKGGTSTHT